MKYVDVKKYIENDIKDWKQMKLLNSNTDISYKDNLLLEDSNGYKYSVRMSVVKNSIKRNTYLNRFFRNNIYTHYNIGVFLNKNNINIELLTKNPQNATNKLHWYCSKHGNFYMSWNQVKNGQSCPKCGIEKSASCKRNSLNYLKKRFYEKGLKLISTTYVNNLEKLNFICLKHKSIGIQQITYANLIGSHGCKICTKELVRKKQTKSQDAFISEVYNAHKDKINVLENYVNTKHRILCKCNSCGNIWRVRAQHLIKGSGCPKCASSKGETLIRKYLSKNSIHFEEQFKIESCKDKRPLPFDFAVFENNKLNCLIEFDGKQHFKKSTFGEKDPIKVENNFRTLLKHDNIKTTYCKSKKIKLIRISYLEIDKIEDILNQQFINS